MQSCENDLLKANINRAFGGRLRLRVCGLLYNSHGVLLIKHNGIGKAGYLWAPPGGQPDFTETMPQALEREFIEETGLKVSVGRLLCVNEYLEPPLHAAEIFFEVKLISGTPVQGHDPELTPDQQMLGEARYFSPADIALTDPVTLHNLFRRPMPEGGFGGYYFG
ncbi:MAG: NUDIX hydrolase [Bacteroidota bacterium]